MAKQEETQRGCLLPAICVYIHGFHHEHEPIVNVLRIVPVAERPINQLDSESSECVSLKQSDWRDCKEGDNHVCDILGDSGRWLRYGWSTRDEA